MQAALKRVAALERSDNVADYAVTQIMAELFGLEGSDRIIYRSASIALRIRNRISAISERGNGVPLIYRGGIVIGLPRYACMTSGCSITALGEP
jgi:hypothetical protein